MIRTYDAALAVQGLTISQLATLAWVKGLRKPTVQKIADLMEMDQSALSRGLVPLDRDGLISSSPDAKDKRKRVLALTAKGETALTKGAVEWAKAQRQIEKDQATRGGRSGAIVFWYQYLGRSRGTARLTQRAAPNAIAPAETAGAILVTSAGCAPEKSGSFAQLGVDVIAQFLAQVQFGHFAGRSHRQGVDPDHIIR